MNNKYPLLFYTSIGVVLALIFTLIVLLGNHVANHYGYEFGPIWAYTVFGFLVGVLTVVGSITILLLVCYLLHLSYNPAVNGLHLLLSSTINKIRRTFFTKIT